MERKPHYTRVKEEFLKPKETPTPVKESQGSEEAKVASQNGSQEAQDATSGSIGSEKGLSRQERKRKMRGMNKNRKKFKKPRDDLRFCPVLIARTPDASVKVEDCKFGEKCKWIHDARHFWNLKPVDIPTQCPFFEIRGWCPYGITCRAGGPHINSDTLESRFCEEIWEKWKGLRCLRKSAMPSEEVNGASVEMITAFRKKTYDFSKSERIVSRFRGELESDSVLSGDKKVIQDDSQGEKVSITAAGDAVEEERLGPVSDEDIAKRRPSEKKKIQWKGLKYLAPLTTVGNLPFRRVCKELGADVTCGEMALSTTLLHGSMSEWSLTKRHESEKLFGVQICGGSAPVVTQSLQVIAETADVDFVDLNLGCPIDVICKTGGGCSLMTKLGKLKGIVHCANEILSSHGIPFSIKMRTGILDSKQTAHKLIESLKEANSVVELYTLHGRSKEQRYTRLADWEYIQRCAAAAAPVPFFGCGDVLSHHDYYRHLEGDEVHVSGIMIARGALIKPWIFTEIDERRDWDIRSSERLDILRKFVKYGLEHWGSDQEGVEKTRRFLLEWLSFLYRYVPVGVLEQVPQRINQPPEPYIGRDDLETLMASNRSSDWVEITKLLLGPVPDDFLFVPKHKANSY